ncbi:50S ribosomal protein L5 [Candidatus Micrarchaeota archaeon]|nr:50S ribosomal protein L5 [Candidatus Micrarchaeota archaeon]
MAMEMIGVEKVTLNIGTGAPGEKLEKARALLEKLAQQKPVETHSRKRIPTWNLKKGMSIGTKVTLRGKKAAELVNKCLDAVDHRLKPSSFDGQGNFAFGVREYIDVPGFKYDPAIGIYGFDVCVTLKKWGYRIAKRKRKQTGIPKRHFISKEEAIEFAKKNFKVEVE